MAKNIGSELGLEVITRQKDTAVLQFVVYTDSGGFKSFS
jgi:hypothetical protein